MNKSKSNGSGQVTGLQRVIYVYGYIELVIWSMISALPIGLVLYSWFFGFPLTRTKGEEGIGIMFGGIFLFMLSATCISCGVFHVILGVILIKAIKKQSSRGVLIYFIFGIITNVLTVITCVIVLNRSDMPYRLLIGIGGLVFSVIYCGILGMVLRCYQQIKSTNQK